MAQSGDIELEQTYLASTERVYAAWTEPTQIKHWWGPRDFVTRAYETDLRPGGGWRARLVSSDQETDQSGMFTVVEPDARLVFTLRWSEPFAIDSEVEVLFERVPEGTRVIFRQSIFKSEADYERQSLNWQETLERSREYVEAGHSDDPQAEAG